MKHLKLLTILLALFEPIAIILYFGYDFKSFSKVWGSELESWFIVSNFLIVHCFSEHPKWRLPALWLLLLTAFSTSVWSSCHNLFAVFFFLSCVYSLTEFKRMQPYLIIYCCSVIIGIFFGLFWFETYALVVLCAYHLHLYKINYDYENRHL